MNYPVCKVVLLSILIDKNSDAHMKELGRVAKEPSDIFAKILASSITDGCLLPISAANQFNSWPEKDFLQWIDAIFSLVLLVSGIENHGLDEG